MKAGGVSRTLGLRSRTALVEVPASGSGVPMCNSATGYRTSSNRRTTAILSRNRPRCGFAALPDKRSTRAHFMVANNNKKERGRYHEVGLPSPLPTSVKGRSGFSAGCRRHAPVDAELLEGDSQLAAQQ